MGHKPNRYFYSASLPEFPGESHPGWRWPPSGNGGNPGNGTANRGPHWKPLVNGLPRIGGQVLDAQGKTLVVLVDIEDLGLHHLPLLVELGGVLEPLGPGNVGDVHQAVEAFINADEDAEIGNVFDFAFDDRPHRAFLPV